jgi:Zn-dependent protease
VGSILVPSALLIFHSPLWFGWAKPIPLERANLRSPRNDSVTVALAGPLANFLLALAFAGLVRAAPAAGFWAPLRDLGYAGVAWNCAVGLLNLIPIPPLDGSWVLMRFLRLRHIVALHHFRLVGLALVVLLLVSPVTSGTLLEAPLRVAVRACLDLLGAPRAGVAL